MDWVVHIHLCGHLRLAVSGAARELELRGRQGRLLFAFLVLHRGRPVSRDGLVEALWGEEGLPPSEGALAPVLSRLRRAVHPARVEGRDSVALVLPEPAWIDVEAARGALERARATSDATERLAHAREAVAIAEPGLLPGLEASWLEVERASLDHLRVEALELGASAARAIEPPLAESLAREAIAAAPFRESAWAALISALHARGNVAEALHAFEEVRTRLREELGAVPGRELLALHSRLLAAADEPPAPRVRPGRIPDAAADLVERDDELRAVDAAVERLARGEGGVVLFEGPAGIGKTRLLAELGGRAAGRHALVLKARGGLLEREFGFGVARQLLEPVVDATLLDGPAAAARAVLSDSGTTEGTFPILNGLYRLVERLAAERPVALCIDDLQWSDPASLRFVAYLARRVAGLPVLIAATIRTGEPEADEALLGELAQEPVAIALSPRPLTAEAADRLVRLRLGADADAGFSAACHEVTAGNPLLLRQLLTALAAEDVVPTAAGTAAVREIGRGAVARSVLLRLRRLPEPAVAVARAVAVLGEEPGLPAVAGLADATEPAAAGAIQALARAEILRADESLGFVHPLIRDAVYSELTAPERALEHLRAARLLDELGTTPERVAAQLLLTTPRGDPWVVARLRDAAQLARRRGAPDAALRLLERAQTEPPPASEQAAIAFELGSNAAYVRGPAGVEPLERAYAELSDPAARARAAVQLSNLLLFVRSPAEGVALANRAAAELPDGFDDFRDGLRAVRLLGAAFGAVDPIEFRRLDDVRRGPRGTGPGGRALTALTSLAVALTCEPAAEASALARDAFSAGLAAFETTAPVALASAALALGEPAEGLEAIRGYGQHARRQGEILGSIGADLWGGITQIWAGDLRAAMDLLERAHEGERLWGTKLDAVMAYSAAFTALAQLERGDPPGAAAETLHRVHADDPRPDGARFWLASLAELALADERPADAVAITQRLEPTRPPDTHPVWAPWRSLRSRALAALGDMPEARRLALEDLELCRRVGARWVIGRGLRILAELPGPNRLEVARDAVASLTESSARLEAAKARATLGDALSEAGLIEEARAEWAAAAQLAHACGAAGLARRAAEAAGGERVAATSRVVG
jgi:DNA-binding SARP family transcriptional activator/tetratricopeptide (TPR) repeat protein